MTDRRQEKTQEYLQPIRSKFPLKQFNTFASSKAHRIGCIFIKYFKTIYSRYLFIIGGNQGVLGIVFSTCEDNLFSHTIFLVND